MRSGVIALGTLGSSPLRCRTLSSLAIAVSSIALATLSVAAQGDAPERLLTRQGVDIVANEDVFALFAALNAAGYSEETEREGPPLGAPVFHPVRVDVREALREARTAEAFKAVRKIFKEYPEPIEIYIEAVVFESDPSGEVGKLQRVLMPALAQFRRDANLAKLFDRLAEQQRDHALMFKQQLEADFETAKKILQVDTLKAPPELSVVPNLLDGHDEVRTVQHESRRCLVVGPSISTSRAAVLEDVLTTVLRPAAKRAFEEAPEFQRSWDNLKTSRLARTRYGDGVNYLARAVARAVIHRVTHPKGSREGDEDFFDNQTKEGMRWARAALKVVDIPNRGDMTSVLPSLLKKTSP